jgi:eukaryotic-like serine/threonine-protein kinase
VPVSQDKSGQSDSAPSVGDEFGRYRLLQMIGKGGMAEVFCAVAQGVQGFERVFVIKRIRPDRSDSPKFVQMFCEEARISALLHHPNIVEVYDFGQIDGAYFMAMEYLRGKDLSTVMRALRGRRDAMPPSLAAFIAREVARALHHAHTAAQPDGQAGGVVHRDVTPSNIMLMWTGGVKILDFGIARAAALARPDDRKLNKLEGKLAYLSPEQVRGTDVDRRSDIFSLGVVLWEMIAGQRLFVGVSELETMRNVLTQPIAAPSRRRDGVPAALDVIVARALARDPARRYATAEAMADDLDRFVVATPRADRMMSLLLEQMFGEAPRDDDDRRDDTSPSKTYTARGSVAGGGALPAAQPSASEPNAALLISVMAAVIAAATAIAVLLRGSF